MNAVIAMVTETYPPEINGVAKTLQQMVVGMLDRGHSVQLIRPGQGADDHGNRTHAFDAEEIIVPGAPLPGYNGLRFGLWCKRRLLRHWSAIRPDVIYVATEGLLGHSAMAAARSLDIPVITGFHTQFDHYSRHYHLGLLEPAIRRVLRRFHNRAECTLVPTQDLRKKLEHQGFGKCRVMSRGVDIRLFSPVRRDSALRAEWGLGDQDIALIHVGRLAPEKNLPLVIKAFEAFRQKLPNSRCVLVGDGPDREKLQREYPDVIFAGMRTGEDLARHYASGDLFLFPSVTDTFGNVVLEAMASSLPVLAFDYAAPREHIRSGISGFLAPYGDETAFCRAGANLAERAEMIPAMGRSARGIAEGLDWSHEYDRLEALFLSYVKRPLGREVAA